MENYEKLSDVMEKKTLEEIKEGIQKRMDVATEGLLEVINKHYEEILAEKDDLVIGEWFRYDIDDWIGENELIALLKQGSEIKNLEMKKYRGKVIQKIEKLSYYPDITIIRKDEKNKRIEIIGNPKTGNVLKIAQKIREEKICEGDQCCIWQER